MPTIILRPGESSASDIQLRDVSSGIATAQTVIYLDTLESVASDIELRDPTTAPASGASEFTGTLAGTLAQPVGSVSAVHGVASTLAGEVGQLTGDVTASTGATAELAGTIAQVSGEWAGEASALAPEASGGGGGGSGERRRPTVPRYRRFRLSEELRRELEGRAEPEPEPLVEVEEEEAEEQYAEQVVAEALVDFGGLRPTDPWIAKVPSTPPRPVVEALVAAPSVSQWEDVLDAIREAQQRAATKAEQEAVARYRREVEAIRARVAKQIRDEQEIEWMMAEGWL